MIKKKKISVYKLKAKQRLARRIGNDGFSGAKITRYKSEYIFKEYSLVNVFNVVFNNILFYKIFFLT